MGTTIPISHLLFQKGRPITPELLQVILCFIFRVLSVLH